MEEKYLWHVIVILNNILVLLKEQNGIKYEELVPVRRFMRFSMKERPFFGKMFLGFCQLKKLRQRGKIIPVEPQNA